MQCVCLLIALSVVRSSLRSALGVYVVGIVSTTVLSLINPTRDWTWTIASNFIFGMMLFSISRMMMHSPLSEVYIDQIKWDELSSGRKVLIQLNSRFRRNSHLLVVLGNPNFRESANTMQVIVTESSVVNVVVGTIITSQYAMTVKPATVESFE